MTLCSPCQLASDAWLDYRVNPPLKIASGSSRDDTAAGVADGLRARYEEWRNTIRNQQALIQKLCTEQHQGQKGVFQLKTPGAAKGDDSFVSPGTEKGVDTIDLSSDQHDADTVRTPGVDLIDSRSGLTSSEVRP